MVWTSIIAALLPAAVDMVKETGAAVSRKWIGLSVDEEIKLDQAKTEKLKVIALLENPYGTPSQWIVDLRASFRYLSAAFLILAGIALASVGAYQYFSPSEGVTDGLAEAIILLGLDTAGAPFSFIFGERMWSNFRGFKK